jgi:hypothetical protein
MGWANKIIGWTAGNGMEVDASGNANVNLPVVNSQAGFARVSSNSGGSVFNDLAISSEGNAYVSNGYQILDLQWNSASTTWYNKINTVATTMTKAVTNGFMRLNSASITTINTGISIASCRPVHIEEGIEYRFRGYAKHTNIAALNKQVDFGLGYYAFAAGQAAAMNEFIGFRWTTTGGLLAVVETSQGGAPVSNTAIINGNVPYSDAVSREYEMIINESQVIFIANGAWVATLARPTLSWSVIKGISLPFMVRGFNTGTAASLAWSFDVGNVSLGKFSGDACPYTFTQSKQGKSSYYYQPDITAAALATHSFPASGTAPTAAVGSNTASAFNLPSSLGGLYRCTLTGVTITLSTNILVSAYLNPAFPTVAGVATNARNFVCTGLTISPMVVSTAFTGGGFTAAWFAAIGSSAVSLATTDADGTTAPGTKGPRYVPLSLVSLFAATAALGVVSTDVGDHQYVFPTPLVIHPGEYLEVGFRTIYVLAAITAGSVDGTIGVNGYWE